MELYQEKPELEIKGKKEEPKNAISDKKKWAWQFRLQGSCLNFTNDEQPNTLLTS